MSVQELRVHHAQFPLEVTTSSLVRGLWLDLDNWFEEYKARNGRPGKQKGVNKLWDERKSPVSSTVRGYGTSTKLSEEDEFAKALANVPSRRRKSS